MNILGLFGPGPNPSAALLSEGKLLAWVEEERLNRIKTSPDSLPIRAAKCCLEIAEMKLDQVDMIAYGWDSPRYVTEVQDFFNGQSAKYGDRDPFNAIRQELTLNLYHPERLRHVLQIGLGSLSKNYRLPPIKYYPHHFCHAASAFYCSGFDEANILSLDGSGEDMSTLLAVGRGKEIKEIKRFRLPHTLGGYYATFTEYLGFIAYRDEGKLMGLAAYGTFRQDLQDKLAEFLSFNESTGDFSLNPFFRYVGQHTYGNRFTDKLVEAFGPNRRSNVSALEVPYPDIAFAVQWRLEKIVIGLARQLHRETGLKKLCLAGGVAMNCVMNGKLAQQDFIEDIFVQPAASDNGVSLGAALLYAKEASELRPFKLSHLYWGPEYTDQDIERELEAAKLEYHRSDNIAKETAHYLSEGKIVGWFQGRMEVGARALGGRSILANPIFKDMKDKLNLQVKHREHWRPFCPSMKEEQYPKYIRSYAESPFMVMAFPVQEEYRDKIPSCVHVDGTARSQAVKKADHPRYWQLIDEFEKLTGYGVILNTSFNIQGEPIVCSPRDALRCFGGTGIDVLAIGNFIVAKPKVEKSISKARTVFEPKNAIPV